MHECRYKLYNTSNIRFVEGSHFSMLICFSATNESNKIINKIIRFEHCRIGLTNFEIDVHFKKDWLRVISSYKMSKKNWLLRLSGRGQNDQLICTYTSNLP